jgi:hypothetical protein
MDHLEPSDASRAVRDHVDRQYAAAPHGALHHPADERVAQKRCGWDEQRRPRGPLGLQRSHRLLYTPRTPVPQSTLKINPLGPCLTFWGVRDVMRWNRPITLGDKV